MIFCALLSIFLESTLSGPGEALINGQADIAITAYPPSGSLGEAITKVELIAVAHPQHPLHQLGRELAWNDLRKHRQVVVKDSGRRKNRDAGWLGAEQRLTVTQGSTALAALEKGMAFAWLPKQYFDEAKTGSLAPLRLSDGQIREVNLLLVYADRDYAGPATKHVAARLCEHG